MTTVSTAVLLATASAEDGGAAADLAFQNTTLVSRLRDQLASLGVDDVHVVRRPDSPDLAADLAYVARVARSAPGGVLVAHADLLTQREALAGLLGDPRIGTGVLSSRSDAGPGSHGLRSDRGRVIAAASPFHTVGAPSEWFLGALKVTAADAESLAAAAERLAPLAGADWGQDALALLLVALVREGLHVGQSDIRELFWARPLSQAAVARAAADIG
ncbi:MAG: CDP-alcohol phosphatidyltransferase, partial [Solirubrobacteraceae bacterium]|nr:CDP-alcohol phosphatidyltransferase [Solirubrobacteraceae bacterium]